MPEIILASGSLQRKKILEQIRVPYTVVIPEVDESRFRSQNPVTMAETLAVEKARKAAGFLDNQQWIFGFDTVIDFEGSIIGKPENRKSAKSILERLSGRIHRVLTGIALLPGAGKPIDVDSCISMVHFRKLEQDEIEYYLDTNEWVDAAGAYRIQERGEFLVDSIEGSYSNIVGLPICLFYGMLRKADFPWEQLNFRQEGIVP